MRISDFIEKSKSIQLTNEDWYRARKPYNEKLFSSENVHLPDSKKNEVPENRYNHYGQPYLYLTKTIVGAAAEVLNYPIATFNK